MKIYLFIAFIFIIVKGEAQQLAPSPTIRISCRVAASGNEPLIVVDGIPYDSSAICKINPADIVEVHVLKSPTAETIYGCRAMSGVIIITTKHAYRKKFIIQGARSMHAINNATIEAKSTVTGQVSNFIADAFGRFETDSLKTNDYDITISSTGYKTFKQSLKSIIQNKGEVKLEPEFVELKEVVVVGHFISCGRKFTTCYHQEEFCGSFICGVKGIKVQKHNRKEISSAIVTTPASIHIYPNPVAPSGTINISFPNVKPGLYQLRLLSATGQLFYSFQKQISSKGETEQIHLNDKILPGMYIVQVIDDQKKLIQSSKIVVQ